MNKTIGNIVKDIAITGVSLVAIVSNALAIDVPKMYENYQSRATAQFKHSIVLEGNIYCVHKYDLTNPPDKKADVIELYPAVLLPDGRPMHTSNYPIGYWFDKNGDGKKTSNESLVDEAGDGLNGNEYWEDRKQYHNNNHRPDETHLDIERI